jgi:hypothetical protein
VPSVKALLSRIHKAPRLASVLPPFMSLAEAETELLYRAYEGAASTVSV